jgi:hypothetical protein
MRFVLIASLLALSAPVLGGQREVKMGIDLGYAHEFTKTVKTPSRVQLAIGHVQLIPTLWNRPGKTIRSVEVVNELGFMQSIRPGSRFILGVSEILRLNYTISPIWSVYSDTGLGIASSAMRVHENSGWMQYLIQGGAGLKRCRSGEKVCWLTEYRYMHMSNNGTTPPNEGLNLHAIFEGLTF